MKIYTMHALGTNEMRRTNILLEIVDNSIMQLEGYLKNEVA
jgi:hypothetical protein